MTLTVFTPTYNRKELLRRVYESLCLQTLEDFKWLIVDDGSVDGTGEAVKEWQAGAGFEIVYHYRENGGKMRAHNTGVSLCDTELFVCLDSDDIFPPYAVEKIVKKWQEFKDCHFCMKQSAQRAGMVAYKGTVDGGLDRFMKTDAYRSAEGFGSGNGTVKNLGLPFPASDIQRGYSTLRGLYLNGFKGETTLVFCTGLLAKHPFPEIEGEKYVPEDYVYDQIDEECPLLVMDEVLTLCELMEGGYTDRAAVLRRENPVAWRMYYEQRMKLQRWSLLKIKYISHYLRFCEVTGERPDTGIAERIFGMLGAFVLKLLNKT